VRLTVEQLEDRLTPSTFKAANVKELISDINKANKAGGANTIVLTAPVDAPYTLTDVDNTTTTYGRDPSANGLPVIAANDILTIVGNGDTIARSSASGTPAFRFFEVVSGASLTMQNLTLQGGLTSGFGEGGAIDVVGGTVNLSNDTLASNTAQPYTVNLVNPNTTLPGRGGAIFVASGTVTLNSDSLSSNLAGYGGAIYVASGTVTLGGDRLCSNVANEAGIGVGGAVYIAGGSVSLLDCSMSDNVAQASGTMIPPGHWAEGGAVCVAGGTVTMRDDSITGNSANGRAHGIGGGIYIASTATAYLDAFTVANIFNNTATTSNNDIYGSYTLIS
jgi:hypothetical protein